MPSKALAARFSGAPCPESMNYSFVHGVSPAIGKVTLSGSVLPQVGSLQTINIGPSVYVGYVTNREYDPINDVSTIQLVDWRDRLHDEYFRAAINMQEDDGRFYHVLPQDWQRQRKTYVTRELGQADFLALQKLPPEAAFQLNLAKNDLYTAATLIDWLGKEYGFVVTAERLALDRLQKSYPLDLDFNNGSTTIANAIQLILSKCGLQFTCFGLKNMHITIRGYSENAFSVALVNGLANLCTLGVSSGKIGEELNQQGRRVAVIGDRNKHEWAFVCRQNWNPAWTWGMAYNGVELGALLVKLGLTPDSKLGELPEKYHDSETWSEGDEEGEGGLPARRTRNDMKIREYLEKIVYKAYVVDARLVAEEYNRVVEDKFEGEMRDLARSELKFLSDFIKIDEKRYTELLREWLDDGAAVGGPLDKHAVARDWNNDKCNFLYPLARTLNSDSNLQYIVYATTRNIIRGADFPFGVQHSLVPRSQGVSLDVEEVVNPDTGKVEYRVRVYFNEAQYWVTPGKPFDDPRSVQPDTILVRLNLEKDFYIYKQGENAGNLRVREQVVSVRSLYQAYVQGELKTTLRDNFRRDLEKKGEFSIGLIPVKTEDIAKRIATQALAHAAISKSGNLQYEDMAGTTPDGLIDSVNVTFTDSVGGGITESVNFTTGTLDFPIQGPGGLKVSTKFRNEEEIIKDRLLAIAKAGMKDKGVIRRAMAVADAGLHEPGALVGVPASALAYAKDGIVPVEYSKDILEAITEDTAWGGGTLVVLGKH